MHLAVQCPPAGCSATCDVAVYLSAVQVRPCRHTTMGLQGRTRPLKPQDLEEAYRLESEGFPPDEAASYDAMLYRYRECPELFLGYFEGYDLIGYVCATRYNGVSLNEESMRVHEPMGESVCIHSVCVDRSRRREGIALRLLEAYKEHVRSSQKAARRILLVCHAELIPLYTRAGFTYVGKSPIKHGSRKWFEFECTV